MTRTSNVKIIQDATKHTNLLDEYVGVIERLQKKYKVSDGDGFRELVNFKTNKITPKHGWYEYKQGYAEELVKAIIKSENPKKDQYVFDPFAGVGTTNLVAQALGYKSIGFDINPVAFLAAKTKTTHYDKNDIAEIKKILAKFDPKIESPIKPEPRVITSSFTKKALSDLYKIKHFCEQLDKKENEKMSNFFRLAFISIIEDCSIRTKDGNGIKLNLKKKPIENIFSYFRAKCELMMKDIGVSNYDKEVLLVNGSMLIDEYFEQVKKTKVGISIFSPPYANCFDYCEVYKLEFWMGNFVKDYSGFKFFRDMAMRSHVNSSFDHKIKNYNKDIDVIANTIATYNIWNKNIPDMLRGYFDDTYELLKRMKDIFVKDASCYIVVANSGYKGILVPTDLLVADIAKSLGYEVEKIMFARKIRSSSQQMKELNGKYDNLMRESIVVIRKT
jgi:DNA modification methylase